jgi:hypothetical protein
MVGILTKSVFLCTKCFENKGAFMKSIVASISSVLFLAVLALGVNGHQPALADTSTVSGCVTMSLASGSVTKRANGEFDYVLLIEWNCPSKPFMGQLLPSPSGTTGILAGTLRYDPAYFFTPSSSGAILVRVTGKINGDSLHRVNNLVQLFGSTTSWAYLPVTIP